MQRSEVSKYRIGEEGGIAKSFCRSRRFGEESKSRKSRCGIANYIVKRSGAILSLDGLTGSRSATQQHKLGGNFTKNVWDRLRRHRPGIRLSHSERVRCTLYLYAEMTGVPVKVRRCVLRLCDPGFPPPPPPGRSEAKMRKWTRQREARQKIADSQGLSLLSVFLS